VSLLQSWVRRPRRCSIVSWQHGVYNADPHPGNYRFAPDGRVTLLDFGCVKRFSPDFIRGWKRIARAVLADDLRGFEAAWRDAGFVGRSRNFDFAHQLAAMRFLYKPALTAAPFRFTHEYVAEVHDRLAFKNANKLKLALPPDWLFVNRLQFGLFSVLAHLGASVRYDILFRDALT
jgi:predicted unusual protein kinase regulating ubiquinone biosynthesis (AarF/ABC1/UbiB family)